MKVTLVPALSFDFVNNLFQYYIYDMSEYTGWAPFTNGTFAVVDSVTMLSDYWHKAGHYPYLIMAGEEVAGFSLIRNYPQLVNTYDMGQFFVLRKFKRQGIGEAAFKLSVQAHPGKWLVRVLGDNLAAKSFWNRVISEVANGEIRFANEVYKQLEMQFIYFEVAVLHAENMASYIQNPAHVRANLCAVTDYGLEVIGQLTDDQSAWANAITDSMDEKELRSCLTTIRELIQRIDAKES